MKRNPFGMSGFSLFCRKKEINGVRNIEPSLEIERTSDGVRDR